MPSLTQAILDRMNGIPPAPPAQPEPKASKKGAREPREPRAPLTESEKKNLEMLKNLLRTGVWMGEFTKVNGEQSVMECTLDPRLLPNDPDKINPVAPTTGAAAATEDLVHVYSLDRQGWRAFVCTKVTKLYKKPEFL